MTYRVTVLPRAERGIQRNAQWWAKHHSFEQAALWLDTVQGQIETLCDFPEANPLSAENDNFPYEIRDRLVGRGSRRRYRAILTIRDDQIFVLAVRACEEDQLGPEDVELDPEAR